VIVFYQSLKNEGGSVLSSVLIISVIVLTLIGAIFSGILLQSRFIQRDIHATKALYLAEYQLYEYLIDPTSNHSSIEVKFQNGLNQVISSANVGSVEKVIQVLVGEQEQLPFELSTVVLDNGNTLTLTGNTVLNGDYAITNNSITTSSFRGFPFRGNLDGELVRDTVFVELNSEKYLIKAESNESLFEDNSLSQFEIRNEDLIQSYLQNQDTLFVDSSLELEINEFPESSGFTLIVNGGLFLSGSATLPDFTQLIVRDSLFIGGELSGSFLQVYAGEYLSINEDVALSTQVISKGTIEVSDNAYLKYPSILYSLKETYSGGEPSVISINDQAIMDGTILYPYEPNLINQVQLKVTVDTTAIVRGAIYTKGLTELFGTVHGTVITDQFYFYESPTSYFNWIKDATIDRTQRPDEFILPIGFSASPKFEILYWRILK
jgi:hypothetical protein